MTPSGSVVSRGPLVLDRLPVRIDPDEVLRFQGYKKGVDVPSPTVEALFAEALAEGDRLMEPRAVYAARPVITQGPESVGAGGEALHIPDVGRLWGTLTHVGAGICTVGRPIEERVRELFDARELPLAVMLDSVASAAVESLAEYVNDWLCQAALPDGLKVTNRISPGYAGWDVAEQAALFRLCDGAPIGVSLNEACFMTPVKTISFLVGVGAEARVDHYFTQCRRCWMRDCAYRRAPALVTVRR
ncbi:MAG TPA: vitamin B12 dependent-methionine synthase activation domain-containing protein [Candidatus Limnocylindrales bacterium]|nr:vitamin B12 dependent-methionine synthase activation domain-containing protein [Candidatus Limnocylindrales bacterium]